MRIVKMAILLLIIASLTAYVTKPSDEDCKKEAMKQVANYVKTRVETSGVPARFTPFIVEDMTKHAREEWIKVEDRLFWKTIRFTYNGERMKNIGWAAYGSVRVNVK